MTKFANAVNVLHQDLQAGKGPYELPPWLGMRNNCWANSLTLEKGTPTMVQYWQVSGRRGSQPLLRSLPTELLPRLAFGPLGKHKHNSTVALVFWGILHLAMEKDLPSGPF